MKLSEYKKAEIYVRYSGFDDVVQTAAFINEMKAYKLNSGRYVRKPQCFELEGTSSQGKEIEIDV